MRFEPSGWSGNPRIGYAKSIVDYIFRWLELKFITGEQGELFRPIPVPGQLAANSQGEDPVSALGEMIQMGDAPACNMRFTDGAQRNLLPLRNMWKHKRVLVAALWKRCPVCVCVVMS